jgi:hypothetical protein
MSTPAFARLSNSSVINFPLSLPSSSQTPYSVSTPFTLAPNNSTQKQRKPPKTTGKSGGNSKERSKEKGKGGARRQIGNVKKYNDNSYIENFVEKDNNDDVDDDDGDVGDKLYFIEQKKGGRRKGGIADIGDEKNITGFSEKIGLLYKNMSLNKKDYIIDIIIKSKK